MKKDEVKIRRKEYCEIIRNGNLKRIYDIDYREHTGGKIQLYKKNYFQNGKNRNCIRKIERKKMKILIL